jgi:ribosome-associated toxin RatA of RatAB toxin-antitoxin module
MSKAFALALVFVVALPAAAADDVKVWAEPVAGSDVPFSIVEASIDAPASVVWSIVSACNDYTKTMPSIAESKELSREGDPSSSFTTVCSVTADMPFPISDLTSVTRARHTVEVDKRYERRWTMLNGDYEYNEGSWTVVALTPMTSKATYRLRVRPKLPVPDSMLGTFQSGTMPKIMDGLRRLAKERAAKAAPG